MSVIAPVLFLISCYFLGRALGIPKVHPACDGALALGLGFGVTSLTYFVVNWIHPSGGFAIVHWLLFAAAGFVVWRRGKEVPEIRSRASSGFRKVLTEPFVVLCAAGFGVSAYIGLKQVFALPHGEWDAWAIWNLHSRFLVRGGENWTAMFSPALTWAHTDYPMMTPALTAAGWRVVGSETVIIPAVISLLFSAAVIAALVGAVRVNAGPIAAAAAGLVMTATPKFWQNGTIQTADIPLAFYILATIILLWTADHNRPVRNKALVLAGFAASLAAWTKNEGLLFLVTVFAVSFLFRVLSATIPQVFKETALMVAGAVPGLAVLFSFKFLLSPPSEFSSRASKTLLDFEHYGQVLRTMAKYAPRFGSETGVNPIWILLAAMLAVGFAIRRESLRSVAMVLLIIPFMVLGYSFIFQITPYPLEWHIGSSLDRLLLQLWPALLFALFASLRERGFTLPVPNWIRAMASVAAFIVGFGLIVRDLPPPSAVAAATTTSSAEHFVRVLPASGLHVGWAQLNLPANSSSGAWMIMRRESNNNSSEAVAVGVDAVDSGVVPVLPHGRTGVGIINPDAEAVTIEAACGSETAAFTLQPGGRLSAFLDEAPFKLPQCSGAFRFRSSRQIGVMTFLTTESKAGGALMEVPIAHAARDQATVHIPYVLEDPRVPSLLVLTNPLPIPLKGTYRLLAKSGSEVTRSTYSIQSWQSALINVAGLPSGQAGRLEIVPDANNPAPAAFVVLGGAVVVGQQQPGLRFQSIAQDAANETSSFVIANPGADAATVRAETVQGDNVERRTITVPPHSQLEQGLSPSFKGFIHVEANSPILMTVVRNAVVGGRRLVRSSAIAIPEVANTEATVRYFPQVVAGSGYSSEFALGAAAQLQLY